MVQDVQCGAGPLLGSYARSWRTYSSAVRRIDALCLYLNKVIEKLCDEHLPGNVTIVMVNGERMEVRLKPVGVLGLHIWKKCVLLYARDCLENVLVREILHAVHQLRTEERPEVSLRDVNVSIRSFNDSDPKEYHGPTAAPFREPHEPAAAEAMLFSADRPPNMYESDVEAPFIAATREFYAAESLCKISDDNITGYIHYAETRLREEIQRAKTLFPISAAGRIVAAVETELITAHTSRLQTDFGKLLSSHLHQDLGTVFRLLKRIPDCLEPLTNSFEAHMVQQGRLLVEEIRSHYRPDGVALLPLRRADIGVCGFYVAQLGPLLRSFQRLVQTCFEGDAQFSHCIERAFQAIVALPVPCTREDSGTLLAEFFDLLLQDEIAPDRQRLQAQQQSLDSAQIYLQFVEDGVSLVGFLETKEPFFRQYVSNLAKRLLHRLSRHGDVETRLIERLGVPRLAATRCDLVDCVRPRGRRPHAKDAHRHARCPPAEGPL